MNNCKGRVCMLQPGAKQAMLDYPWPGNIRELKHALERACVMSEGRALTPEALFEGMPQQAALSGDAPATLGDYLADCERSYILRILDAHQWQIQTCAAELGISRKNLWEKMKKLGIEKDSGLPVTVR